MRILLVLTLSLLGLAVVSQAQSPKLCQPSTSLLKDNQDKPVLLTHIQLKERAIKTAAGVVPGVGCVWRDTLVVVDVIINEKGVVECAAVKSKKGHPLIKAGAVNAAKKWMFEPFLENGKPVAVQGKLEIFFVQNSGLSGIKNSVLRIE